MYKSIILNKIEAVKESRALDFIKKTKQMTVSKDKLISFMHSNSFLIVGTSRKRQSSETKNIKRQAKRQRVDVAKVKRRPAKFSQDAAKVLLIVFGVGMFGKDGVNLKGNKCRATGVLWRAIKRREKEGGLLAITIDEFKTSKICYKCYNDSFKKSKKYERFQCSCLQKLSNTVAKGS
ncbi:uncharacterized protein BX663DRAFT_488513 [Cokeromyces recurvatus]|uniref:uncharacterized protein n=1 Tax=Cokeromyces recurvatus TaxID=90255 RepID=UPI00221ECD86|nr:uncharacterized protein BX663DRAFT_488513 [Cokeromyces recurvatus]KAI7900310.1 hypothetical protein BX663DRAFT_488513 [Cokeromyces recurvatus]